MSKEQNSSDIWFAKQKEEKELDMVNHPPHYTTGKIEVIDFIEDQKLPFHEAQVIKYVTRARHKNNELEDLKKAAWYLNRLIEQKEKNNETL